MVTRAGQMRRQPDALTLLKPSNFEAAASIAVMTVARYDGLADEYDAFVDSTSPYHAAADDALRRLLGPGEGRCLDLGCGGGHFLRVPLELGWQPVGVDVSDDQLRIARTRHPELDFVRADANALPFPDESFDAAFSTFTHTDFESFAGALAEARRVLRSGGRFIYVGNHPCFVGPTQEHTDTGVPRLHPGYRRAGRWPATEAPGTSPGGWRARLGSFVHLPLADFLSCFAGFTLEAVEELDDGYEYPKTIALALRKP
jgi:SAM-dependent methyltransferase